MVALLSNGESWDERACTAIITALDSCARKNCLSTEERKRLVAAHVHLLQKNRSISPLLGDKGGHQKKASQLLNSLSDHSHDDNEIPFLKATFENSLGNTSNAERIFQSLVGIPNISTFGFDSPAAALAGILRKTGDWQGILQLSPHFDSSLTMFVGLFDALCMTGKHAEATLFYSSTVSTAGDNQSLLDGLFDDMKPILDRSQINAWEQAKDPEWKRNFLIRFWRQQNPTLNRDDNPRLIEHYRRLDFARTYFSQGKSDCRACFDDRGLAYVRRGQPNIRYFDLSTESWIYGDSVRLDFVDNSYGAYELRPLRLDQFEERAHLHPFYQRMAWRLVTIPSPRDRKRIHDEMLSTLRSDFVRIEMNDFPRTTYSYPSKFDHLSLAFRSAGFRHFHGQSLLDFSVFVPHSELVYRNGQSTVQLNVAVFDSNFNKLYDTRVSLASVHQDPKSGLIDLKSLPLPPDRYLVAIEAINNDTDKVGIYQIPVVVRSYVGADLMISDLELAAEINNDAGRFFKSSANVTVIPNAASLVDKTKPVYLYFEVYNLTLDDTGRSQYEIGYTVKRSRKRLFGFLGGGKQEIAQITKKQGNSRTAYESIGLDLNTLAKGPVTIEVEVRDLLTTVRKQAKIEIVLQ